MMKIIFVTVIMASLFLPLYFNTDTIKLAHATGGGIEIAKNIMPNVERAIQALEQGNIDKALYELDIIDGQLKDQFSVKQYEKENEEKNE